VTSSAVKNLPRQDGDGLRRNNNYNCKSKYFYTKPAGALRRGGNLKTIH